MPPVDVSNACVGLVGRFGPSPDTSSGIPAGLARGMRELGLSTFLLSAEPFPRIEERLKRLLTRTGHFDRAWEQTPRRLYLHEAMVRCRSRRLPQARDAHWVQMGSEFGHPLGSRFVTLGDMTVASATRIADFERGPLSPRVERSWIRRQQAIYDHSQACCVASRWHAESLVRDYGIPVEKIHVVGFGWNIDVRVEDRDWGRPRFLYVGLGWQRKNGAAVVEAFRRLRQERLDVQLDLVGDHPPIEEEGIVGHGVLRFGTESDRVRLADLYRRATCFVMPSLYEPFGIVYAEAGRAGLPSIATEIGGAADAVGPDGGILVPPRSPDALLSAMRQLADGSTAAAAGANAARHAARLSWRDVAARVAGALGLTVPGGPVEDLFGLDADFAATNG